MHPGRVQPALEVDLAGLLGWHNISAGPRRVPGVMDANQISHDRQERDIHAQFRDSLDRDMIQHRMNRNNYVWLHAHNQAQQALTHQWTGHCLHRCHRARAIGHMEKASIEAGVVANSRSIELDSLAQRKAAILLENVNDLNTIGWWLRRAGRVCSLLLALQPPLALFLSNKIDRIA